MVLWQTIASIGLPEQVDVVLTADEYHSIRNKDFGNADVATINQTVFLVLKPGGVF